MGKLKANVGTEKKGQTNGKISARPMPRCSAPPSATACLADTELFIEVEKDYTIYGEEVKFGGGKVIRDGMGQSRAHADVMDTVITNA
jgi:hypothetical protein